jgi:carbon-monoxide dehydrogenase large subunit
MARFGIGQPVTRSEDKRFLTGAGRYVDDMTLPRQAYAVVLRSPHAHARITAIDAAAAKAMPGVLAVLTGADYKADGLGPIPPLAIPPGWGGRDAVFPAWPPVADGRVRFAGEVVACVVAETQAQAADAAERVEVAYDPLPAVPTIAQAIAPGAPALLDGGRNNVIFRHVIGNEAATAAAMAGAAHTTSVRLRNNRITANSMETRGAIGDFSVADGRFTLYLTSQVPHRVREQLASAIFRRPVHLFRVVANDVGGGFGMKGALHPEEVLALWAAWKVRRPVKWIPARTEGLLADMDARDEDWEATMAFDCDGRILAIRTRTDFNIGAYCSNSSTVPPIVSTSILSTVYDCKNFDVIARGVVTNSAPTGAYRGAGHPEATYAIERLIDQGAAEMGIDRLALRRLNYIRPQQMPYRTALTYVYDCGEFEKATDVALPLARFADFAARRAESEQRGRRRGIGFSYFIELAAQLNERMDIRLDQHGGVTVIAGTHSHGQGHDTIFAQMICDWLGVPFESVNVVQGDTDRVPFGRGTFASRSMVTGGSALRAASDDVIAKGKRLAAHLLEAAAEDIAFNEGKFTVAGTDRGIALTDVAKASFAPMGLPAEFGLGLEGSGVYAPKQGNFPNGCHVCEVEVDPETGVVEIVSYTAVDDVGRAINPLLLSGQVHGGIAQGVGQALMENLVYDEASGQLLAASFLDYCMPRADNLPSIKMGHHDVPTSGNPLGVKGAGEAGTTGATPAVINAILDALRPLGVRELQMPATSQTVWRAIAAARAG